MKRPRPDTRPRWDDPELPVLIPIKQGDQTQLEPFPATDVTRWMAHLFENNPMPDYKHDPTYDLKKETLMSEKYETIGGMPTVGLTYARLHERLIGCQEDCAMLSHLIRAQSSGRKDNALADGWHALSEMMKRIDYQVTALATSRLQ